MSFTFNADVCNRSKKFVKHLEQHYDFEVTRQFAKVIYLEAREDYGLVMAKICYDANRYVFRSDEFRLIQDGRDRSLHGFVYAASEFHRELRLKAHQSAPYVEYYDFEY